MAFGTGYGPRGAGLPLEFTISTSRAFTVADWGAGDLIICHVNTAGAGLTITLPLPSTVTRTLRLFWRDVGGSFASHPLTFALSGGGGYVIDPANAWVRQSFDAPFQIGTAYRHGMLTMPPGASLINLSY